MRSEGIHLPGSEMRSHWPVPEACQRFHSGRGKWSCLNRPACLNQSLGNAAMEKESSRKLGYVTLLPLPPIRRLHFCCSITSYFWLSKQTISLSK